MPREIRMVKKVYSSMADYEWNRLIKDEFHRCLEYDTSCRFLKKYLPRTGLLLDAGGGPGRYTIELARQGYDIVLLDLVKELLERAKEEIRKARVGSRVKQIVEGTITDLSRFKDNSFDAVLCLGGPLSHVCPEPERLKAVSELVRVAKKGAPIFVSVMSKYGVLLATPGGWPEAVVREEFTRLVQTGDDYEWMGEGYSHFFTSAELEQLFLGENVRVLQKVGLEGFNADAKTTNDFATKHPESWNRWLQIHNTFCTDPFGVDASGHIMIIVTKK